MKVDELAPLDVARLDDVIEAPLFECEVGVQGLQTGGGPYLLPLSYGYDGDRTVYFTFVGGEESRKRTLAATDAPARFLVYDVRSARDWQSALLTGEVDAVPADEWEDALAVTDDAWRPAALEAAQYRDDVACYRLDVTDWDGLAERATSD